MSISSEECPVVQISVLITCVSLAVMTEGIKYTLAYTGDKWGLALANKWGHIFSLCLLVSVLIKGFVYTKDVSGYLLHSSVGFSSYSINYLRYFLLHVDEVTSTPAIRWHPLHTYFYSTSLACNIFACVYVLMDSSYIDSLVYLHTNDACFLLWSVIGLWYGMLCMHRQVVHPSLESHFLTSSVPRQILSLAWCILQITVIIFSLINRVVSHPPARILLISYLSCVMITQWGIVHVRDRLSPVIVVPKDNSYCHICTQVVEVDPIIHFSVNP
jgi:hypothetical protein